MGENRPVKSIKLLFNAKTINPMLKYSHITELCTYILYITALMPLLPVHF